MQNRTDNHAPWSRPLQPSGVARPRQPVGENGLLYTPNEPDRDEEIYAARAAAARRRATGLRPEAPSPAPEAKPISAQTLPVHADAVLYSSATGIHPQREPENAFEGEEDLRYDPDADKPTQPGSLTRRRRHRDASAEAETARPEPEVPVQQEPLQEKAQRARERVKAFSDSGTVRRRTRALQAAAAGEDAVPAGETPAEPTRPIASFAPRQARAEEPFTDENDTGSSLLVNTSNVPFGLRKGLKWKLNNRPEAEDEEAAGEDHMDSGRMPVPVPASAAAPAKPRRKGGNGFLIALIVVMLLVAACGFLWLSGMGEKLLDGISRAGSQPAEKTIRTGEMSVVPENAAVPTALVVTLSTDTSIADLRLLNDQNQVLAADVICNSTGEDCLWICRLVINEPYTGFIRAQLLTREGDWIMGSSSRYVNIN